MSPGVASIIRNIEDERDAFVARCNAAIKELQETSAGKTPKAGRHRFSPKVTEPKATDSASPRPRGRPKKQKPNVAPAAKARRAAKKPRKGGRAFSVRKLIREAVRAQTKPFTLRDIKIYIDTRYPDIAGQIDSDRYSKELYYLRTVEQMFDLASAGEKGAPNVFMPLAA